MSVIIRDACISDAPRLLEIYSYYVQHTAISFEYTTPTQEEFCRRMRHIMSRYPYLVAEVDGKAAGMCNVKLKKAPVHPVVLPRRYAYIDDICILPDFRHMGVGKALYEALAERIRPMGIRKVELKVWAFNESAMGFYEALGMKPQNIIMEGHI